MVCYDIHIMTPVQVCHSIMLTFIDKYILGINLMEHFDLLNCENHLMNEDADGLIFYKFLYFYMHN